jgi:hypothetical protein
LSAATCLHFTYQEETPASNVSEHTKSSLPFGSLPKPSRRHCGARGGALEIEIGARTHAQPCVHSPPHGVPMQASQQREGSKRHAVSQNDAAALTLSLLCLCVLAAQPTRPDAARGHAPCRTLATAPGPRLLRNCWSPSERTPLQRHARSGLSNDQHCYYRWQCGGLR